MKLLEKYQQLNTSYPSKFVFNLGNAAGFFSEYNNMILAMIYSLQHKKQFILFSKQANFRLEKGWTDYFLPFCEESENPLHAFNRRTSGLRRAYLSDVYKVGLKCLRMMLKDTTLTSDVWEEIRSLDENTWYNFPELQLEGDLRTVCKELVAMTWRYNSQTSALISGYAQSLGLPEAYLGFHIRGGDKFVETKIQSVSTYIQKAEELSSLKKAFVLTDDYRIIEELRKTYSDWDFYTLCHETERGYFHLDFKKQDKKHKADQLIKLFASMEFLAQADLFIGTFSSNPGMYLGMRMDSEKAFSIDLPKWKVL